MPEPLRIVASEGAARPEPVSEAQSFEEFFEAQSRTLYRRLCLITGNRQEAEEVLQDAFISVLQRWDRVSAMDDPTGYLYRTAFRLVHMRWKRAARILRQPAARTLPADEFAAAEDREVVRRALGMLSKRQRTAIVLTELLGYSSEEAGRLMGTRAVTARVLASQGRAVMRRVLEDRDD